MTDLEREQWVSYLAEIREAVLAMRKMFRYHDKERMHNVYQDWNDRVKRVDDLLQIEVDKEGRPVDGYYFKDSE